MRDYTLISMVLPREILKAILTMHSIPQKLSLEHSPLPSEQDSIASLQTPQGWVGRAAGLSHSLALCGVSLHCLGISARW